MPIQTAMLRPFCLLGAAVVCAACGGERSSAPRITRVPNVVGLGEHQAAARVRRAALRLGTTYAIACMSTRCAGSGRVTSQDPDAGTRVRVGTVVTLTIFERESP